MVSPGKSNTSQSGLKLKLINKGGMWEPVREGLESDSLPKTEIGKHSLFEIEPESEQ